MASSCFLSHPPPPVTPLKLFAFAWLATALVALAAPVAIGVNGDGPETVTVGSLTAYSGLEREFLRLGADYIGP